MSYTHIEYVIGKAVGKKKHKYQYEYNQYNKYR